MDTHDCSTGFFKLVNPNIFYKFFFFIETMRLPKFRFRHFFLFLTFLNTLKDRRCNDVNSLIFLIVRTIFQRTIFVPITVYVGFSQ